MSSSKPVEPAKKRGTSIPSTLSSVDWFNVFNQSPNHIVLLNKQLQILYTNQPSPGLTMDNLRGRPIYTLVKKERQDEIKEILTSVVENKQSVTYETQYDIPDGNIIYYESEAVPWQSGDQLLGVILLARDITEQKILYTELAESENRFSELTDLAPVGIYLADNEGQCVYANKAWLKMAGMTLKEALGRGWSKGLHPDDREEIITSWNKAVQEKTTWDQEYRFMDQQGNTYWVRGLAKQVFDVDGENKGFIGVNIDITDKKNAEFSLREKEEQYRIIADFTVDWEIWINPQGEMVYCSPSCERITGYKAEEFFAQPDLIFLISAPEDRQTVEKHFSDAISGKPVKKLLSYRVVRKNGELRWIHHACQQVFDAQGEFLGIRGSNRDISEKMEYENSLQESEKILAYGQKMANFGSWYCNLANQEAAWSNGLYDIYGWKKTENDDHFKMWNETIHPDDKERISTLEKSFISGDSGYDTEYRIIRHDNQEVRFIHAIAELAVDENGELNKVIGVAQDITEQKKMAIALEEERNQLAAEVRAQTRDLRMANRELLNALRIKDEFLANMSHELRTPLTAIMGMSEILSIGMRGPINQKQEESIQTIRNSGEHLLELINDILDLSKIKAGKLEIEPSVMNIDQICHASLGLVKEMAHKKHISLAYKITDPNLKVMADGRRLKQILVNLLSNAVKFTSDGGHVDLDVSHSADQSEIIFAVKDDGIGISKENLNKLFQPFTQLDTGLSRQYEGSGLGLALVQDFVDLHHGRVTVESEGVQGKGSCFKVFLPWQENREEPTRLQNKTAPQQGSKHPVKDVEKADNQQKLILLVEDNPANITTFSEYLQASGYQVIVAQNGQEGVERAVRYEPDLILMDIQMPIINGLEATQELRKNEEFDNTPIIALTALAMPGDDKKCFEAGANDYLTKPIQMKNLIDALQKYLK